MKKLFAPLLLCLAVLLVGGCANNTDAITAGLRADLVRLQRASNGDIKVTWRVRNPNVVGYVLTRHALKISLDGVPVGTVTGTSRFGIPAMNQAEQTHLLTVTNQAAVDQAITRGSAGYALDATLWLLIVEEEVEKFQLTGSGTVPAGAE